MSRDDARKTPDAQNASETPEANPRRHGLGWASITVAIFFGLFFAYELFEALGNLVGLPAVYAEGGIEELTPWWLLVVGVLIVPLAYLVAFLLGLGRDVFARALIFVVALAAINALALTQVAVVQFLVCASLTDPLELALLGCFPSS